MSSAESDEALAALVQGLGLVTAEQLAAARQLQAQARASHIEMSLSQALMRLNLLTPEQEAALRKRIAAAEQAGGPRQFGNYRLLQPLGQGGVGTVFLAQDVQLNRHVAVKVLSQTAMRNTEFLKRFRREAVAAGKLNHANIACAFAFGEDSGIYYYVMEYCEGETLAAALKRLRLIPEQTVLAIAIQVSHGLSYAHAQGVLHRDIKPGNIIVTRQGVAKILDLGLSKAVGQGDGTSEAAGDAAAGTPHYMSPEQARGDRNLDGRTDIYSLGATLYHLLTGRTPFEGPNPTIVAAKRLTEHPPDPRQANPSLSEGFVRILSRALSTDPADRYASMAEMHADLARLRAEQTAGVAQAGAGASGQVRRKTGSAGPVAPTTPPTTALSRPARQTSAREGLGARRATTGPREPVGPDGAPLPGVLSRKQKLLVGFGAGGLLSVLAIAVFVVLNLPGAPPSAPIATNATGAPPEKRPADLPPLPPTAPPKDVAPVPQRVPVKPEVVAPAPRVESPKKPLEAPARTEVPPPPPAPTEVLEEPEPPPADDAWAMSADLLAGIDTKRDAVRGTWSKDAAGLLGISPNPGAGEACLAIPFRPPEEYDFRVAFVRESGSDSAKLIFTREGAVAAFTMGSNSRTTGATFGLEQVDGRADHPSTTKRLPPLEDGKEYVSLVQVRRDRIVCWLNGELVAHWKPAVGRLNASPAWTLPNGRGLGLGVLNARVLFRKAELLEASSKKAEPKQETAGALTPAVPEAPPVADLPPGDGLKAEYFANRDLNGEPAQTRVDAEIRFDWGQNAPFANFPSDNFSVRWSGWVLPERSGSYSFYARTDDGVRLWVNGKLLFDRWVTQGATENSQSVELEGSTPAAIKMEYFEGTGDALASLSWSGPALAKTFIGRKYLHSNRPARKGRRPAPDAAAQAAAQKKLREQFRAEYAKSAAEDKLALANALFALGRDAGSAPDLRFVALREGGLLAAGAGEIAMALKAVAEGAELFEEDAWTERLVVVARAESAARTPEAAKVVACACLEMADEAAKEDQLPVAMALAEKAEAAAQRAQDAPLARQAQARTKDLAALNMESRSYLAALNTLTAKPDEAEANLVAGKFRCFRKGDWERGLENLAKGSEAALGGLAALERARPATPAQMVALGDGWWNYGARLSPPTRDACQGRAVKWYEEALPKLTGVEQAAVTRHLDEYSRVHPGRVVNLVPLVDTARDTIGGTWRVEQGALVSDDAAYARIEFPYEPPAEYDFRITFTRKSGTLDVRQMLCRGACAFTWTLSGFENACAGFELIRRNRADHNPTTVHHPLVNGRKYTCVLQVRKNGLAALLDDKKIVQYKTDFTDLGMTEDWALRNANVLGVGSFSSPTIFHSVEVIEVTGRGRRTR